MNEQIEAFTLKMIQQNEEQRNQLNIPYPSIPSSSTTSNDIKDNTKDNQDEENQQKESSHPKKFSFKKK